MARLIFLSVFVISLFSDSYLQQIIENVITKHNETSATAASTTKARTLYDYQTHVVAYKDLAEGKCCLEILRGGESRISRWISSGSKDNISKSCSTQKQLLSKYQTWRLAGDRITEFCKGFPTCLIKDVANDNSDVIYLDAVIPNEIPKVRRKRSSSHYFQGRVRGQTQSQYLNFGKVDQPGKAEAESTLEGSKAVVSGSNGMGQAQSQNLPFGCEECYGQGNDRYDQSQTLQFGPQRPGEKYPQSIVQGRPGQEGGFGRSPGIDIGRPGATSISGEYPGQFDRGTDQIIGGPGQIFTRPGETSGAPGQFGGVPGQTGGGHGSNGGSPGYVPGRPDQFVGGPGDVVGAPGNIGAGPGQTDGHSGQIAGAPGQIGAVSGQIGEGPGQIGRTGQNGAGPGQIGENGQFVGGPGQIGSPGQTGERTGQIGDYPGNTVVGGQIGVGPGHIAAPGQFGVTPGQISGRPWQNGGPGQIGEGPGQIDSGRQIGTYPEQVTRGPSQATLTPGQYIGRPGQADVGNGPAGWGPRQTAGTPGQIAGTPGQIGWGPGQTGGQNAREPGQILSGPALIGGPVQYDGGSGQTVTPGQNGVSGHVGGIPGQVGGHISRAPGQIPGSGQIGGGSAPGQIGGGTGPVGWTDQFGRTVPTASADHTTGHVIDLGESVRRPNQQGGVFGGQLSGDYQSHLGQAGRFSGSFTGQYEVNGHGSGRVGHSGQSLYTGQTGTGYQPNQQNGYGSPGGGQTSQRVTGYGPEYPSQPGVQGPSVGGGPIYQTGPGGSPIYQPSNGVQDVLGTRTDVPGYQSRPTGYERVPEQYIDRGTPGQYGNGVQGPSSTSGQNGLGDGRVQLGPYGPQYGSNGGAPSQFGSTQIPGRTGFIGPGSGATGQQGQGQRPLDYGNGVGVPVQYGIGTQQGGPGYGNQQGIGGNRQGQYGPYGPGTTGQYGTGGQPGSTGQYGTGRQPDSTGQYGTGAQPGSTGQYGTGGQYGPSPTQYTDNRYPGGTGLGTGQQLLEGTQEIDDSDSQVQTSVQQTDNGTLAQAEAQGTFSGGTAQSQVSGTYSGSGSFSASAGSDDGKRGAQTQVAGGKDGAQSSAQGRGGLGQSQSQVVLSSETGDTLSSAQTSGFSHGTQSQVHASEKGGMADAQSNGPGSTSSQAQIGFTPHDENAEDNQDSPFKGGGTAGAQSGSYSGMTQAQIQGKFKYGIKYTGAAQAGSGALNNWHNQTKPGPFKPVSLPKNTFKTEKPETRTEEETSTKTIKNTNKKTSASTFTPTEAEAETANDGENKDYTEEDYEADYEAETEKPSTRSIVTQSSDNQRQHIIIDPLENLDLTVHQSRGDFPAEGTVLQPGETIPGSPGYKIPTGFRGTVKSIANGRNTYAIGKHSQAQSATLSPGSGRIIYKSPLYAVASKTHSRNGQYGYGSGYTYQPAHQPVQYLLKNGRVLPNFLSVTKSETGSKNLYTGKKTPSVYYTQSSSCGIFTNHCVFNGSKKVCFPKFKTNPDGSRMGC